MEKDKSHLTLVDEGYSTAHDQEFTPLPFYAWDERPHTHPLDQDECATAIHLAHGDLPKAAELLKTPMIRLARLVRASPRLQRILTEHQELYLHRAAAEVMRAFDAPDDRRREWAAKTVLSTRMAQGFGFAPAPANQTSSFSSHSDKAIVIHWGPAPAIDPPDDSSAS